MSVSMFFLSSTVPTARKYFLGKFVFLMNWFSFAMFSSVLFIGKKLSDAAQGIMWIFSSSIENFSTRSFFVFSETVVIELAFLSAFFMKNFSKTTALNS